MPRWIPWVALCAACSACDALDLPAVGDLGQPCFGNRTCLHASLECVDRIAGGPTCEAVEFCQGGRCLVLGATFQMGCREEVDLECRDDEKPRHAVTLSSFWIDQTEATIADYEECVVSGICTAPDCLDGFGTPMPECAWLERVDPAKRSHPINDIRWEDAKAFCERGGRRLCTEAEWEFAARGIHAFVYPWGDDECACDRVSLEVCTGGPALPVGALPAGKSPFGALDMAGNADEFVLDWYARTFYAECPDGCVDPTGPSTGDLHIMRGGGVFECSFTRSGKRNTVGMAAGGIRCCVGMDGG